MRTATTAFVLVLACTARGDGGMRPPSDAVCRDEAQERLRGLSDEDLQMVLELLWKKAGHTKQALKRAVREANERERAICTARLVKITADYDQAKAELLRRQRRRRGGAPCPAAGGRGGGRPGRRA